MNQLYRPELIQESEQNSQRQLFPFFPFFPRRFFPFFFLSPFFFPFFREDDERNVDFYTHHDCKDGDTMDTLAEKYNVPKAVMTALNPHIQSSGALKSGEKVGIPKMHNMYCQTFYREDESSSQSWDAAKSGALNAYANTGMLENMGAQPLQTANSASMANLPSVQGVQGFANPPMQPNMHGLQPFANPPMQPNMHGLQPFANPPMQPNMHGLQPFANPPMQPNMHGLQPFANSPNSGFMNYPGLQSLDAPEFSANYSPMPMAPNQFSNMAASMMSKPSMMSTPKSKKD